MKAVGISGTIEIVGDDVRMTRHRMFGQSAGDRVISIRNITGVAYAEAAILTNGHIQILHRDRAEVRGIFDRLDQDPDTIVFARNTSGDFAVIRDHLRALIDKPSTGLAKEIEDLVRLKDQGILTNDEFEAGKRKILGL